MSKAESRDNELLDLVVDQMSDMRGGFVQDPERIYGWQPTLSLNKPLWVEGHGDLTTLEDLLDEQGHFVIDR